MPQFTERGGKMIVTFAFCFLTCLVPCFVSTPHYAIDAVRRYAIDAVLSIPGTPHPSYGTVKEALPFSESQW